MQQQRDTLTKDSACPREKIKAASLDLNRIDANRGDWSKLSDEALKKTLTEQFPKAEAPRPGVHPDLRADRRQAGGRQKQAGGPVA